MRAAERAEDAAMTPSATDTLRQRLAPRFLLTTRGGRVALAAAAGAAAKLVSVFVLLALVPLTLKYLGPERYGLWMAMNSATFLLGFSDFGVGSALLTIIAEAHGRNDREAMRSAATNAVLVFAGLAGGLLLLAGAIYALAPWRQAFAGLSPLAQNELGPSMLALVAAFAASLPLNVTSRIQMGLQCGYRASLWGAAGSVASLFGVLLAIALHAGLPWLVLAYAAAPPAVAALNALVFFFGDGADLRPRRSAASIRAMQIFFSTGSAFLAMQILTAVNVASDNLIIAKVLGPSAVTQFSVPERAFALISIFVHLALQPLWPAYAEARSRGDWPWIGATFRGSLRLALLGSVGMALPLVLIGDRLIKMWTFGEVAPSLALLVALALWKILDACEFALTVRLSGLGRLRPLVLFSAMAAASVLTLKLFLAPKYGVLALPYCTIVGRLVASVGPLALLAVAEE